MKRPRVLVTGGAGFIGRALTAALAERGCEVGVVDSMPCAERGNGTVESLCADVASPLACEWMTAYRPQVIFHLAAQIDVRQSVVDPAEDARVNVLGTVCVARAATMAASDAVIFSSSGGAIYGDADVVPTAETAECRPLSPYGASKRGAEVLLETIGRLGGTRVAILRYANVYGPGQDARGEGGVVSIFGRGLTSGRVVTINGDGEQTRDFVHVDDVVAANLAAWERRAEGCFNVGTGIETTINSLFVEMARLSGSTGQPHHGSHKLGEVRRSCLDVARARDVLAWTPRIDLQRGLRATLSSL